MKRDKSLTGRSTGGPTLRFLFCLVLYAMGVAVFVVWEYVELETQLITNIDRRLLLAAKSLKYVLAPDFHDRAVDEFSITFEEELQNRASINELAAETNFQWLYTLAEKDGKFYFSAPTVSEEEAKERKRWYFLPYDDIPEAFVTAFKQKQTMFAEYTDQWGTFRSVALPRISPGGRRYLACVDYDISFVQSILLENLWQSIFTALFFLLLAAPFVIVFKGYATELEHRNRALDKNRELLEQRVEERTAEHRAAKEKAEQLVANLETALEKINTLSGLIPICASCKQIRDDKGYWHQVEEYIRAHSEVDFSHAICPECITKLYPQLKGSSNRNKAS